jgi:putative phosphoribosyl transferase
MLVCADLVEPIVMRQARFRDRTHAGEQLAEALLGLRGRDVLVLAMPRGGVPVAFEVATALDAELDVLLVRKLGVPSHPEFGFGAIAAGAEHIDRDIVDALQLTPAEIDAVRETEREELARRERVYRGDRPAPRIAGRTVLLIDDGVATGGTAIAALDAVRRAGPERLVFAAPLGPPDALERLRPHADDVVLLETPEPFGAVGAWYQRFDQTEDDEVLALLAKARGRGAEPPRAREVSIGVDRGTVRGDLVVPVDPVGLVIFAHGSGSSRFSPRNQYVARVLQQRGLATLLMDLLTREEERVDERTREHRFDIPLLARRLVRAAAWARAEPTLSRLPVAYVGSSTGGGAALLAAAQDPEVRAVVSRGGRPDLAGDALPDVRAETLLIVGERDEDVIELNEAARRRMRVPATMHVVPGATHLFEEPGTLEEAAGVAAEWLARHLAPSDARATPPKEGISLG